jgi:hypothetical protein
MSPPSHQAVPSLASEAPRKRRAQRWTDTAATLLLGVSVAAVLATALPSLLRAAGASTPAEESGRGEAAHLRLPTPPPGAPGNPIVAPEDDDDDGDEPRLTQLERDFPEGMLPGHRTAEERARDAEIFGAPRGGKGSLKAARAGGPLRLFKEPLPGASVVAIVAPGAVIQIVREVGGWALIKYLGGGEPITGWVQKSEISAR